MPKRRKKKIARPIYLSAGPLPTRLADKFPEKLLVFSDASQKRQGGLAAVLFGEADSKPLIATRSVALTGSNELELQAAVFALHQAWLHFPGRPLVLFSDNHDAVSRLNCARELGLDSDPELAKMLGMAGNPDLLVKTRMCWIKAHSSCRGNHLADQHAAAAAS